MDLFDWGHHTSFILLSYGAALLGLGGLYVATWVARRSAADKIAALKERVRSARKG